MNSFTVSADIPDGVSVTLVLGAGALTITSGLLVDQLPLLASLAPP